MSFPRGGVAIPANDSGTSISLSQLRLSWGADANIYSGGSDPGSTNLSISEFDNANFSDGTSIDADGSPAVTIGTHFCGKTFLIPVTGVTLAVSDTTPGESTTITNFATATISPANANGTIVIEFRPRPKTNPVTTGFVTTTTAVNTMNYTFGAVSGNESVGSIGVRVRQNGGSIFSDTAGPLQIQDTVIAVTGVTLAVSDTTPNESSTITNFATATVAPSNANGTIILEFSTVSSGGTTATPATTGSVSGTAGANTMNYTFGAVSSNTNIGHIQVTVKQNGSSVGSADSGDITIQNGRR